MPMRLKKHSRVRLLRSRGFRGVVFGRRAAGFLLQSTLLQKAELLSQVPMLKWASDKLHFDGVEVNSRDVQLSK